MSTDTEVQENTQVKPAQRTYFSTSENLILIRIKPDETLLPGGKLYVRNKADYERYMVRFTGNFYVASPGDFVCPNPDTGDVEDVVTFLENHPRFGQEFHLQEQTAPDPTEAISRMAECLATGDNEGLVALYEEEKGNWARPQVLEPIEAAVAKIRQAEEK